MLLKIDILQLAQCITGKPAIVVDGADGGWGVPIVLDSNVAAGCDGCDQSFSLTTHLVKSFGCKHSRRFDHPLSVVAIALYP